MNLLEFGGISKSLFKRTAIIPNKKNNNAGFVKFSINNEKLSAVAASYLEYINQEKNRIIKEKFGWYEGY